MVCEICQSPDIAVVAHMSGGVKMVLCAPCDRACRPDDFPDDLPVVSAKECDDFWSAFNNIDPEEWKKIESAWR